MQPHRQVSPADLSSNSSPLVEVFIHAFSLSSSSLPGWHSQLFHFSPLLIRNAQGTSRSTVPRGRHHGAFPSSLIHLTIPLPFPRGQNTAETENAKDSRSPVSPWLHFWYLLRGSVLRISGKENKKRELHFSSSHSQPFCF